MHQDFSGRVAEQTQLLQDGNNIRVENSLVAVFYLEGHPWPPSIRARAKPPSALDLTKFFKDVGEALGRMDKTP